MLCYVADVGVFVTAYVCSAATAARLRKASQPAIIVAMLDWCDALCMLWSPCAIRVVCCAGVWDEVAMEKQGAVAPTLFLNPCNCHQHAFIN